MSFIQLTGLNDAKELPIAAEGRYPTVIVSAKLKDSSEGDGKNIMVVVEIEADRKYQNIFHYVALPRGEDKDKDQTMVLMAKRFFTQYGIPFDDGVEIEQIVGCRADCNIGQDEYQGQNRNVLKIDRLATEE